jgi:hypothetical protein
MKEKGDLRKSFPNADKVLYITPDVIETYNSVRQELYLHHLGTPGPDRTIKSLGLHMSFEPNGGKRNPSPLTACPNGEYPSKITRALNNGDTLDLILFPSAFSVRAIVTICLVPDEDFITAHAQNKKILVMYTSDALEDITTCLHVLASPTNKNTFSFKIGLPIPYAEVLFDSNSYKIVCFESNFVKRALPSHVT